MPLAVRLKTRVWKGQDVPFKDLETKSLTQYLADERTRPGDFWLFMHIPKTAGSSFSAEMSARMQPYKNIYVENASSTQPFRILMAQAADDFAATFKLHHWASASGHLTYGMLEKVRATIPNLRMITFLRSPEARVVSDYRYQRTPMHPPYQQFIERFPTLESYVLAQHEQNKMTQFIMGLGNLKTVTEEMVIAQAGTLFSFIGVLEKYPMSFNLSFDLMGHAGLRPSEHQRKTPDTKETEVQMTRDLRHLIRETNKLDQALFDYVRSVLLARREEWAVLRKAV